MILVEHLDSELTDLWILSSCGQLNHIFVGLFRLPITTQWVLNEYLNDVHRLEVASIGVGGYHGLTGVWVARSESMYRSSLSNWVMQYDVSHVMCSTGLVAPTGKSACCLTLFSQPQRTKAALTLHCSLLPSTIISTTTEIPIYQYQYIKESNQTPRRAESFFLLQQSVLDL
jgi:hypothetical protein